ncbi:hypothetical protein SNK05_13699 [Fusarium graminearum]
MPRCVFGGLVCILSEHARVTNCLKLPDGHPRSACSTAIEALRMALDITQAWEILDIPTALAASLTLRTMIASYQLARLASAFFTSLIQHPLT